MGEGGKFRPPATRRMSRRARCGRGPTPPSTPRSDPSSRVLPHRRPPRDGPGRSGDTRSVGARGRRSVARRARPDGALGRPRRHGDRALPTQLTADGWRCARGSSEPRPSPLPTPRASRNAAPGEARSRLRLSALAQAAPTRPSLGASSAPTVTGTNRTYDIERMTTDNDDHHLLTCHRSVLQRKRADVEACRLGDIVETPIRLEGRVRSDRWPSGCPPTPPFSRGRH
jgi:hypothetical protein